MKVSRREKARLAVRALWVKACKHDGIPTDAKFVSLSQNNPFDVPYNKAMERYIRIMHEENSISVI
jgi:hypothetical protein